MWQVTKQYFTNLCLFYFEEYFRNNISIEIKQRIRNHLLKIIRKLFCREEISRQNLTLYLWRNLNLGTASYVRQWKIALFLRIFCESLPHLLYLLIWRIIYLSLKFYSTGRIFRNRLHCFSRPLQNMFNYMTYFYIVFLLNIQLYKCVWQYLSLESNKKVFKCSHIDYKA